MRRAALTLALVLAACARAPERDSGPVLTFYTSLGQAEWQVLEREVFPPFERAHHCTVRAADVPSAEMVRKLGALARAGRMDVDVIAQDNMALYPLVAAGLMADLSAVPLPATTLPALREVGRFGGRRYFLPYRPSVEITFYHRGHFRARGLAPPRDWASLLAVSRRFYEAEGIGRVALKADGTAGTTAQLMDFIHQAGGDPLTLNDAGCKVAFRFLQQLWPYLSPESRRADFNTMNQFLAMESVYLGQNWPFAIEVLVRQGEKTDLAAYAGWRGPVREAHTLGGEVLGLPVGAPHRALALAFVAHLQSREVQSRLASALAWPSMRADADAAVAAWQKPYFEVVNQALAHTIARPNVPYWEDFDKSINQAFREIVVDGRGVDETLDRYAAAVAAARVRSATPGAPAP